MSFNVYIIHLVRFNMKKIFFAILFSLTCFTIQANDQLFPAAHQFTDTSEFQKIKERYSKCTLETALNYSKVTDLDTAFKYAPIACKRDLLQIKKMLIGGPYQMDIINQLVDSVKEGIEIDMVNYVFKEKLKNHK